MSEIIMEVAADMRLENMNAAVLAFLQQHLWIDRFGKLELGATAGEYKTEAYVPVDDHLGMQKAAYKMVRDKLPGDVKKRFSVATGDLIVINRRSEDPPDGEAYLYATVPVTIQVNGERTVMSEVERASIDRPAIIAKLDTEIAAIEATAPDSPERHAFKGENGRFLRSRASDNHHVRRAKSMKKKLENGEELNEVGAEAQASNFFTNAFFDALVAAEEAEEDKIPF